MDDPLTRVRQLRGAAAVSAALEGGLHVGLVLVQEGADDGGVVAVARERAVPVRTVSAAVIRRMTSVGPSAPVIAKGVSALRWNWVERLCRISRTGKLSPETVARSVSPR